MGQPAARLGDLTQHGSPLLGKCAMKTLVGKKPAWRIGDQHTCPIPNLPPPAGPGVPHGPGITTPPGAINVLIENFPAARVGDIVTEPAAVTPPPMIPANPIMPPGCPTVLIGIGGAGGGGAGGKGAGATAKSARGVEGNSNPDLCQSEGHPVDAASGRVFAWATDIERLGAIPLIFRRLYSSTNKSSGPLGLAWSHNFQVKLSDQGDDLLLQDDVGASITLQKPADDEATTNGAIRVERTATGYLIWRSGVEGLQFSYYHDHQFQLTAVWDGAGRKLELFYEEDKLVAIQDHTFRRIQFHYKGDRLSELIECPVAGTAAQRTVARFEYNSGRLVAAYDAVGQAVTYAYQDDLLVRETDRNGFSFYFAYDALGRCIHTWGDDGLLGREMKYDPENRTTQVIDSNGYIWLHKFDDRGLPIETIQPDGSSRLIHREEQSNVLTEENEMGNGSQFIRDDNGRVSMQVTSNGGTLEYTYDEQDRVVREVTSDGAVKTYEYDRQGRMIASESAPGVCWTYQYDDRSNLVASVNPAGYEVRHNYDRFNRLIEVSDDLGTSTQLQYDEFGFVIRMADKFGTLSEYEYDSVGRITKCTKGDGTWCEYVYDGESNVICFRDHAGNERHSRHRGDVLIEMRRPTGPLPRGRVEELVYQYEYDTEQNLTQIRLPDGGAIKFEYDPLCRVRRRTMPDNTTVEFDYDMAGNIIEVRTGSESVSYQHDDAGNIIRIIASNGEEASFEYDEFSRLIQGECGDHVNELEYDSQGRLVAERADDEAIHYEYAITGERVGISPSSGKKIKLNYHARGILTGISADGWGQVDYDLDARGRVCRRVYASGLSEEYNWDARDRVVDQTLRRDTGQTVFARSYEYDSENNLTKRLDKQRGDVSFQFGPSGWISRQQSSGSWPDSGIFEYDRQGNPVIQPGGRKAQYDEGNRILADGESQYVHDDCGRLAERVDSSGRRTAFSYNLYDQISLIEHPDGSTTKYEYDAFGRRVLKERGDQRTRYLWDGDLLLEEWEEDHDQVGRRRQYLFDPERLTPVMQATWKCDSPDEASIGYCHADYLGGVTELTGADGQVTWSCEYDAFGQAHIQQGDHDMIHHRRPGQYFDEESGLCYTRYRYYDADAGRFTTPDPVDVVAGFNLYKYPTNPLRVIDLRGLGVDPKPGKHSFVDTNYVHNLLVANRNNDQTASTVQHANANRGKLLVSPMVYKEFIGQDTDPQRKNEKIKLLKKMGIQRSNPLCSKGKQKRYQEKRNEMMEGGMDANDSSVAAYAAVNDCPVITQNRRDFRQGGPTGETNLGDGYSSFEY